MALKRKRGSGPVAAPDEPAQKKRLAKKAQRQLQVQAKKDKLAAIPAAPETAPQPRPTKKPPTFLEEPVLRSGSKRKPIQGRVRRIPTKRISSLARKDGSTRPGVTRSGAKVSKGHGSGGFQAGTSDKEEELWITNKSPFAYYLKLGLGAFIDRGCGHLVLRAMGAAIPITMTLALAIQDNLPCAPEQVDLRSYTGSEDCLDQILPPNAIHDPSYQIRVKSTLRIRLSIKEPPKISETAPATVASTSAAVDV